MARSNEFTHGGSVGKNLVLLLRALLNLISFAALLQKSVNKPETPSFLKVILPFSIE